MTRLRSVPAHLRAQVPAVDDYPAILAAQMCIAGLPEPARELKFCPWRKFRFDLAYSDLLWAFEINGAIWQQGRHSRGSGLIKEYEKLNLAQSLGWRVYQFSTDQVTSGYALAFIEKELKGCER